MTDRSLHDMPLPAVAAHCADHSNRFFRREAFEPRFCFELLRRALAERSSAAWEAIYRQYQPLVSGWITRHPSFASSGGCLSIQATRLAHTLILSELQPAGLAASIWTDARNLYDYGFQTLFTPDFRGANTTEGGPASDFGVAMLDDTQFVSAALSHGKLKLSSWQIVAGIGQVGLLGSTERSYSMPGGAQDVAATTLAITRIGTLEADGDYLTGQLNGGNLEWRVWRVAVKP